MVTARPHTMLIARPAWLVLVGLFSMYFMASYVELHINFMANSRFNFQYHSASHNNIGRPKFHGHRTMHNIMGAHHAIKLYLPGLATH